MISVRRFLAYIKCWAHCICKLHKPCYHGVGFKFKGFLLWKYIDIVWCYDCGEIFYREKRENI